jgi:hypothetical protein
MHAPQQEEAARAAHFRDGLVLFGARSRSIVGGKERDARNLRVRPRSGPSGARRCGEAVATRFRGTAGERGQGTVEYVGLILLVSLLMVEMVAAMKGFNNKWPLGGLPGRG